MMLRVKVLQQMGRLVVATTKNTPGAQKLQHVHSCPQLSKVSGQQNPYQWIQDGVRMQKRKLGSQGGLMELVWHQDLNRALLKKHCQLTDSGTDMCEAEFIAHGIA